MTLDIIINNMHYFLHNNIINLKVIINKISLEFYINKNELKLFKNHSKECIRKID